MKAKLAPSIKKVLNKYGMKGTIAVRNHSTLVVNIKSGKLDVLTNWFEEVCNSNKVVKHGDIFLCQHSHREFYKPNYLQVNEYHIDSQYTGKVKNFLKELKAAMEGPEFFNNDDLMTDYFSRSHYTTINIGTYEKPYQISL